MTSTHRPNLLYFYSKIVNEKMSALFYVVIKVIFDHEILSYYEYLTLYPWGYIFVNFHRIYKKRKYSSEKYTCLLKIIF